MNLEQLEKIYNTFALVETKGNDTIIMGQALHALRNFIQNNATAVSATVKQEDEKE